MRILDLRIDLPDFRPIPGIAQEHLGDAPQGIAALHDIAVRSIGVERDPARGRLGRRRRGGRTGPASTAASIAVLSSPTTVPSTVLSGAATGTGAVIGPIGLASCEHRHR